MDCHTHENNLNITFELFASTYHDSILPYKIDYQMEDAKRDYN